MSHENQRKGPVPLGKTYQGKPLAVTRDAFEAYARATDDTNSRYLGAESVAPPMYHVAPFIDVMFQMASDPELKLDLLRLVHAEHDMTFHQVLQDGDILEVSGSLNALEEKGSGTLVTYGLSGVVAGTVALEGTTSYFIRRPASEIKKTDKRPKRTQTVAPEADWSTQQVVHRDQALRYATVSGDDNPIHTDEATAKAAGLPGCILHGLCTMAFAQRDLVNQFCDGDPSRLQRLAVRWARPVFPGDTLRLKVWSEETGHLTFQTENEAGQVVMSNGRAEIRVLGE